MDGSRSLRETGMRCLTWCCLPGWWGARGGRARRSWAEPRRETEAASKTDQSLPGDLGVSSIPIPIHLETFNLMLLPAGFGQPGVSPQLDTPNSIREFQAPNVQERARWHRCAQLIATAAPTPGAFTVAGQRDLFWVKKSSILVLLLPPGTKQFQRGMAGVGGCSPGSMATQSPSIPGDGEARGQALC